MSVKSFVMVSLKRGMLLSVSVPLLIAAVLAVAFATGSVQQLSNSARLASMKDLLQSMGSLIHEQQKERGTTSVFLSSGGTQFAPDVKAQRRLTDVAAAEFLQKVATAGVDPSSRLGQELAAIAAPLDARRDLRARIDALAIDAPAALGAYTAHNAQILTAIGRIGSISQERTLAAKIAALEALLSAKEFAGIERAIGSGGFAIGGFDFARLRLMERLITRQNANLDRFAALSEERFARAASDIAALNATAELGRYRDIAFASVDSGDVQGMTADAFFAAATIRINAFKALEDRLVGDIQQRALAVFRSARNTMIAMLAGLALAFAFAAATTGFVIRQMLKEVRRISDAGDRLAAGDETVVLPTDTPRELGRIVYSINFFRESVIKAKAREAEIVRAREATEKAAREEQQERQRLEKERAEQEAAAARDEQDRMGAYVAELSSVVHACARGDFSQRLQLEGKQGAWAEVSDGLNRISTGVETSLNEIRRALGHMAQGDMTYEMHGTFEGVFAEIATATREATRNMSKTLLRVAQSAADVSTSSRTITQTTSQVSQRSEENANMLKQTAVSIEEMSRLVRSATEASQTVRRTVVDVSDRAEAESRSAARTIQAMEAIRTSSEGISKILTVIDEIAFQTNLLALNAGVEAARAGEAGRGFAVVATEVRALAQRSSEAAKEIGQLVQVSAESIDHGVDMVDQTANSLSTVVSSIREISDQIGQITESFETTQSNIDRVAKATTSLDRSTRETVSKIEDAHRSVGRLDAEAQTLLSEVGTFRISESGEAFAVADRRAA